LSTNLEKHVRRYQFPGEVIYCFLAGRVGVVQLTGSAIENPHGLHWNAFKFSAKARLMVCRNTIGRPQTGQMVSLIGVGPSVILD
jgi:hypothetical protein